MPTSQRTDPSLSGAPKRYRLVAVALRSSPRMASAAALVSTTKSGRRNDVTRNDA